IDFLLRVIGPLRRRMLVPFRDTLAQGARLDHSAAFFEAIRVDDGRRVGRIVEVVPRLAGGLLLVGESGLGKTTFLRHLTRTEIERRRAAVFLDARNCRNGVYNAIAGLVQGIVKEESFLKTLIHTRDLAVIIDGLNEVSEATR